MFADFRVGMVVIKVLEFWDFTATHVAFKTPRALYTVFMPVVLFICYFPEPGSIEFMAFYTGAVQADRVSWEREIHLGRVPPLL